MKMNELTSKIPIGSDHGGYLLKKYIVDKLAEKGYLFEDFGTYSEESVDYPDFIHPVAKAVNDGVFTKGIVICGSGQGANMTANKYPEVRSALCSDVEQTVLTRRHNDANILALPGRFINFDLAVEMVKVFFSTDFEGGRHSSRIEKMSKTIR
jgi:ribose 5-phosphate isomerase B